MKPPKEYYSLYLADDNLSELNHKLAHEVLKEAPNHIFEMGCGTGKNLKLILKLQSNYAKSGVCVSGLDISLVNCLHAIVKNGIQHIAIGDETYLRHYCNQDVVITCSCLDHIEKIDAIIQELQRIANKCVILAECTDHDPSNYYYKHDFESFGFKVVEGTEYFSISDTHNYRIYKWYKQNRLKSIREFVNGANDDLSH